MADLLARMARNPAGDWTIADVQSVCRQHGVGCVPPVGGGSHHKVSHPAHADILTVPAGRPIKPIYIRMLVRYIRQIGGENV